jgi:hypothetical protein
MRRRLFFKAAAVLPLATNSLAKQAPPWIELQRSPVAGFQYHQGEAVWSLLSVGDALTLLSEPHNPYDSRAVKVLWQGMQLGYVPRVDNAAVHHLLETGHALRAHIMSLQDSPNPWDRLEFSVELQAAHDAR